MPLPRRTYRPLPIRRKRRPARLRLSPILVMAPLAVFTAVLVWDGPPRGWALDLPFGERAADRAFTPTASDREAAFFTRCGYGAREACVIDGDTFWYKGEKIRVADINTPEAGEPKCAAEAALAARATARMTALLNAGPFTLEAADRAQDRYGRRLAVVTRGGESLGDALVAEGLAEEWRGYRREWC